MRASAGPTIGISRLPRTNNIVDTRSGPRGARVLDASGVARVSPRAGPPRVRATSNRVAGVRARTFSSRRAGPLRRSRAHRPRRRVGVSREGRRRDVFHVLQRLQRDFLFRVSARRQHGRGLNPQERRQSHVVLLQVRVVFQHLRSHVEGRRGRVSGCPGTPGINRGGRKGNAKERVRFPGDSGRRRTASSEPASAFRSVSLCGLFRIPLGRTPMDAARVNK